MFMATRDKSRIQSTGILRHYACSWAEGFAIGDGVRMLLWVPDFVRAHFRTFDGADFVSVTIELAGFTYWIGDAGLLETDEFDLFA